MLYYKDTIQVCLEIGEIHLLKADNWISFVKINFIWNQLTTSYYFNPFEVYGGIKNGDIQYMKLNQSSYEREENNIYKFHKEPLKEIRAKTLDNDERYMVSVSRTNIMAFWNGNDATLGPLYIFSFMSPVQRLVDFTVDKNMEGDVLP